MSRATLAAVAAIFMTAGAIAAHAQVIGPGGVLIAPGPSQPNYYPGGLGPGGAIVSPGPAGRNIPLEQPGPGGIRIAPGPAGSIAAQQRPLPNNQVLYGSAPLRTTIVSGPGDRRHRFRHHRDEESGKPSLGSAALDYGPLRSICRGC